MNVNLPFVPDREKKPRNVGLTMMMDKGLSINQVKNFIDSSAEYTDLVKFGFGTSVITPDVKEKVSLYRKAGIKTYPGGTLFEAFIVRGMFDEFRKFVDKLKMEVVEVSDGSMAMETDEKLDYIQKLSKDYTVLSEIGSKQKDIVLTPQKWISEMKGELDAGSWKVIAEARESGTVGIYNSDGSANTELIDLIRSEINSDNIIWEAPTGKQQIWFIKMQGPDVNLGNIATTDVIPLECLRLGLRGDTFLDFLPDDIRQLRRQK